MGYYTIQQFMILKDFIYLWENVQKLFLFFFSTKFKWLIKDIRTNLRH